MGGRQDAQRREVMAEVLQWEVPEKGWKPGCESTSLYHVAFPKQPRRLEDVQADCLRGTSAHPSSSGTREGRPLLSTYGRPVGTTFLCRSQEWVKVGGWGTAGALWWRCAYKITQTRGLAPREVHSPLKVNQVTPEKGHIDLWASADASVVICSFSKPLLKGCHVGIALVPGI